MPDSQQTGYQANQDKGITQTRQTVNALKKDVNRQLFPYPDDEGRLGNYNFYENLFWGNHFDAFNVKISSENYGKYYARLKFIVANFPGLITKVVSDLLFVEPPKIKMPTPEGQEWVNSLIEENKLRLQWYESSLDNSYFGDALFKLRVGPRYDNTDSTVLIEQQTPKVYFPLMDPFNAKGEPKEMELAWVIAIGEKTYLRKEIHKRGEIINRVFLLEGQEIKEEENLSLLGDSAPKEYEPVKGKRPLVIHIPNWRAGNRWNGISDYYDLETLFYAIDNRMTKIDNILDKHSDPILAVPDGIIDEKGQVKRSKLNLFVRGDGENKEFDPSYITWEANLESAIKEIDKLVEMTFMMSETSPDILGMGQGQAESGRALKLKLLRTLAKVQRKQIYYYQGIRDMIYTAQVLAYEYGVTVGEKKVKFKGTPEYPEIVWRDGLPADMREQAEVEQIRIDSGTTTKKDAVMRLDDIEDDAAEKKVKEIREEDALDMPVTDVSGDTGKFMPNGQKKPLQKKAGDLNG